MCPLGVPTVIVDIPTNKRTKQRLWEMSWVWEGVDVNGSQSPTSRAPVVLHRIHEKNVHHTIRTESNGARWHTARLTVLLIDCPMN